MDMQQRFDMRGGMPGQAMMRGMPAPMSMNGMPPGMTMAGQPPQPNAPLPPNAMLNAPPVKGASPSGYRFAPHYDAYRRPLAIAMGRTGLTPQKLELGGTGLTPMKLGGLEMSPSRAVISTGLTPLARGKRKRGTGKRTSFGGLAVVSEMSPLKPSDYTMSTGFTPFKEILGTSLTPLKESNWGTLSLSPNTPKFAHLTQTPRSREPVAGDKRRHEGQGANVKKAIKLDKNDSVAIAAPSLSLAY